MRLWFQRMASFLRADDTEVASVRAILRTAALRSASIGVGTLDGEAFGGTAGGIGAVAGARQDPACKIGRESKSRGIDLNDARPAAA